MDIINNFIRCTYHVSIRRHISNPALEGVFHGSIDTKAKLCTTASMRNVACYKAEEFAHVTRIFGYQMKHA